MQAVLPSPRVRRAAHYMAAMGLWRPPGGPGAPGPVPSSTCGHCMRCAECFPVRTLFPEGGLSFQLNICCLDGIVS